MKRPKVLIVDDDGNSAETHALMIERLLSGVQIDLACDGLTALRHLGEHGPYDLIISDVSMSPMDGTELMSRIRGLPDEACRRARALALTAFTSEDDRLRILKSGFDEYLGKPITIDDLVEPLSRLIPEYFRPPRHS
jgi:two-component system CheB/CheR fusion protein